jgi:hypothetical protein
VKNTVFVRILFGSAGLFASAGAHAQQLSVDLTIQHSAQAAGMPQVVQGVPTPGFNPQGGPVTIYSVTGPTGGLWMPGNLPDPTPVLTQNPSVYGSLTPALAAASSRDRFDVESLGDLPALVQTGKVSTGAAVELQTPSYTDHCFAAGSLAAGQAGIPATTSMRPCDAISATLKLNGVEVDLSAPENSPYFKAAIPAIGFSFSDGGAGTGPWTRSDSLQAAWNSLEASGKIPALTAALLGKPQGFTLPVGSLPTGSKLLSMTVQIDQAGGTPFKKTFGVDSLGQALAYGLADRNARPADFGFAYDESACSRGTCPGVSVTLNLLGVQAMMASAANSQNVTVTIPSVNYKFTSQNAGSRSDALNQFVRDAKQNINLGQLAQQFARDLAAQNPADPLLGNPNSLQGQLARSLMDLDNPSTALGETAPRGGVAGRPPSWMIGGRVGHFSVDHSEANFVDADAEFGMRLQEGSQARLKISAPFSVVDFNDRGATTASGALRASYEQPIISGRWVVEPSAAAGLFYSSDDLLSSGALWSVGLSSLFKIAPVGRGHIVLGNSVSYFSTFVVHTKNYSTPHVSDTVFRNGLAYQVPVGDRIFGRMGTLRASYTFTNLTGADTFLKEWHEVSLSYGIGGRTINAKQSADLLRIGVTGAFGNNFNSIAATLGYVF